MRITPNRRQGGGQNGDPAMAEVQNDFENLVQTIMGVTSQRTPQSRGMTPGERPPGFPFGPAGQQQQQGQAGTPFMG